MDALSRPTHGFKKIARVHFQKLASVDPITPIDVQDEFVEGAPLVRSSASARPSDCRDLVLSIELVTLPEPSTFIRAGDGNCSDELDL